VRLPTGFVCRAGHPLLKARRPNLADIVRFPIAGAEISPDVARKMVARFGAMAHPSQLLSLRSEDVPSLLALAAGGDVIYMGVIAAARRHLAEGLLRTLRFDASGFESGFGLVRLNGRTEPSGLAVLRRVVQQHLRP
jgi:DNA-binding transcriptional LysR family regulator